MHRQVSGVRSADLSVNRRHETGGEGSAEEFEMSVLTIGAQTAGRRPAAPHFDDDAARWEAVRRRDRAADGAFLYSVRTTGVYCRPSCPARLPRRDNVAFHRTPAEAERAGFRPCKRCRPDGARAAKAPAPAGHPLPALDWAAIGAALDAFGCATTGPLLDGQACVALAARYAEDAAFRSRVVMARHGFGRGEYKYFAYPLPETIARLRAALYPPLAAIANRWNEALGDPVRYPPEHAAYLARCRKAGQTKPTPLLLRYGPGDYNCLHQDVYGEHVFPLQVTVLLSRPGADFTGGEFVLTEQRPRMQSRAEVVPLRQGEAVIFPVRHRPVRGSRGVYRVNMRHGVSRLRTGERYTAGIIFHDAR
jgi:hypothetical protein